MRNNTGLRFDDSKTNLINDLSSSLFSDKLQAEIDAAKVILTREQFVKLPAIEAGDLGILDDFREALVEVAKHAHYGAYIKGYGKGNFLGGMLWSRVVNPLLRHLFKRIFLGSKFDKESGSYELTAVAWNSLALLTYELKELGTNDLGGN